MDYRGASHRLLLRFWHGLGDHIQLGVVLNHIRTLYPQWQVDLACHPDKADGLFHAQLCRTVHPVGIRPKEGDYDAVRSLFFPDPEESYAEVPSTKAERCLREVFNIEPRVELCHYLCGSSPDQIARAKQFATRFSPFVLCHATGHSVRRSKDLSIDAVAAAARAACGRKRHFFLLDLDERGGWDNDEQIIPIRNSADVWGGHGATSGQLAALAREADLCIAIDSGPGKVFASTGAHTITVWSGMHPLHYHGVAQNVFHLVPNNHERFLRGDIDVARNAFRRLFAHRVMERNVADELVAAVTERLLPC